MQTITISTLLLLRLHNSNHKICPTHNLISKRTQTVIKPV